MKKVKLDERIKIETPFEVPKNYFEGLESSIQERVAKGDRSINVPSFRWALVPAMMVIIICGVMVLNSLNSSNNAENLLTEVSNDEIITYLALTDISESEIVSLIDQEIVFPEDPAYLDDLELDEEDLNQLIDQLEIESEYL